MIRLSGPESLAIAQACCPDTVEFVPRVVQFTHLRHPKTQQLLDEGCVVYFKGPASYTGEDVVEFQMHSGPQLLQSIIQACLDAGARLAEKGEFTRRAFMNGKMDLTKAEAVIDLMEATSPTAQTVALSHLEGRLFGHIQTIRERLMRYLEQVEGSIDFPDEVPEIDHQAFSETLASLSGQLSAVLDKKDFGEAIRTGVKVVIVGQPNVGKSSLMNQLLGQERAIVTPIPGTTRDYIEGQFNYGGLTFHLYDTAGLRDETQDVIEQLGMEKIQELVKQAHVIFWVIDGAEPASPQDQTIYQTLKTHDTICCVINKSDQPQKLDPSELPASLPHVSCHTQSESGVAALKGYLDSHIISQVKKIGRAHV